MKSKGCALSVAPNSKLNKVIAYLVYPSPEQWAEGVDKRPPKFYNTSTMKSARGTALLTAQQPTERQGAKG